MKYDTNRAALLLATALATPLWAPVVAAQEAGAETYEDIVVTARRVEENIQDVPLAVTALSSKNLQDAQVTTARDLVTLVPSLNVGSGNAKEANRLTIRGQGVTAGAGPGVSVYLADAPLPQFGAGGPGLYFDLANIQVLNGPQGTLFGRNTTGGAVLFTPQRPQSENSGWVQVGYGDYNNRELSGVLNLDVVPGLLAVRVAGEVRKRDGYTLNLEDGRHVDNLNYHALRASALLTPSDSISNYTIFFHQKSETNGTGISLVEVNPAVARVRPFLSEIFGELEEQKKRGPRVTRMDGDSYWQSKAYGVINTLTVDLADSITFKNISSYVDTHIMNVFDSDGSRFTINNSRKTPLAGNSSATGQNRTEYFTNESQVSGSLLDDNLTYVAGYYYEKYQPNGKEERAVSRYTQTDGRIRDEYRTAKEWSRSEAIFAQATVNLGLLTPALDTVSVTGGYRRTWDRKRIEFGLFIDLPTTGCQFALVYPNCFAERSTSSKAGTYTLAIDWKPTEDVLIYATNRTGYKTGGTFVANPASAELGFRPESVDDIEIGFKADFDLGFSPLRLNVAAFRDKYKDIQRFASSAEGTFIRNAGGANIKGVEVQASFRPSDNLEFSFNYSHLYTYFTNYIYKTGPVNPVNLKGEPLTYSPAHKFGVNLGYALPLPEEIGRIRIAGNYTYQSKYKTQDETMPSDPPGQPGPAMPGSILGGYGLMNINATWTGVYGSPIDLEAYVTNVTNKTYASAANAFYYSFGYSSHSYGEPRMFGFRAKYSF